MFLIVNWGEWSNSHGLTDKQNPPKFGTGEVCRLAYQCGGRIVNAKHYKNCQSLTFLGREQGGCDPVFNYSEIQLFAGMQICSGLEWMVGGELSVYFCQNEHESIPPISVSPLSSLICVLLLPVKKNSLVCCTTIFDHERRKKNGIERFG